MELQVGGQTIVIQGFHSIEQKLDDAYRAFYLGFYSDRDYSNLINKHLPDISKAIIDYFLRTQNKEIIQQEIINNFTCVWNELRRTYPLWAAKGFWEEILKLIYKWETARCERIHKGAVYFYWGGTAIDNGEIDEGFFLMHAAYEEDRITYQSKTPNSSAYKFVSFDYEGRQYFSGYSQIYAEFVNNFLIPYRLEAISNLTLTEFREKFLEVINDSSIVFAFTYTVAKLRKLQSISLFVPRSSFASHYGLNLLFDLVLIIDAALKEKIPQRYYADLIGDLASRDKKHRLSILGNDLKNEINSSARIDFDKTIYDLLNQNYLLKSGKRLSRLECDIAITYCIRNHGAHNVYSSNVVWLMFSTVQQSFFNVLFFVVDVLYR